MKSVRDGWAARKVGELADVARGSSPRPIADQRYFDGGDVPWIKIADATKSGKYLYDTKEKVNEFGASFSKRLPVGSLIIAASGTLGYPQMLGVPGCVHDGWLYLTNFRNVDRHFLYYFFHWKKQHFYNSAYGAAIQNINTEILRNTDIVLPPLPVQERIASVLSAYDDLIENNTRRIRIVEQMAQMTYREWFVNFRFPCHNKTKMVESKMGKVPQGWPVERVTEAIEVDPATKVPKEGMKSFVSMSGLSPTSMLITDIERRDGNGGSKFRNGDTLFARITPCLENGKTGFVQFLPDSEAVGFGSTEFIVLRSRTVNPEYVYLMARSQEFRENAIKSMSGATGRQRVQEQCFERFLIARPPLNLLQAFRESVVPMFRLVYALSLKNGNLSTTRDLLLPRLISGEIEVQPCDAENMVAQGV